MMFSTALVIAACSFIELTSGAPSSPNIFSRSLESRATYTSFGGDGSASNGWPSRSQWLPFETAWSLNLPLIRQSCGNLGWGVNNSEDEIRAVKDAIYKVSGISGIAKEFIFAIIMQESKCCVRAPTTSWGHANPGLMQSAMGSGTCNPSGPISPCPASTIYQMVYDGTSNPALGTTLASCLRDAGTDEPARWYRAARIYNAGRVTDNNLGIGPTPCYASDIANRLLMQFAESPCDNSRIASIRGGPQPAPAPAPVNNAPPKMIIDGTSKTCRKYWTPVSGNTCTDSGIDTPTLRRLNPQLNAQCTNLWADYGYCIVP